MKILIKHSLLICTQLLFSQNLFAHQHCVYPVAEEQIEFVFFNLSTDTCITQYERPSGRNWRTICEQDGRLTRENVEVKLSEKDASIICNVINGIFDDCNTPWGGDVYFTNHNLDQNGRWAQIDAILDKKNRLISFNKDDLPSFVWLGPIPKDVLSDPYLFQERRLPGVGIFRGQCEMPVNEFLYYSSEVEHKRNYVIDGKTGYYATEKRVFVKLGPQIKVEQNEADF